MLLQGYDAIARIIRYGWYYNTEEEEVLVLKQRTMEPLWVYFGFISDDKREHSNVAFAVEKC